MMVGGGGENYGSWSDNPYGWFVEKAGFGKIINIDVDEASDWYPTYFESLGASITSYNLQIATEADANSFPIFQELLSADGIFIEGGDQWDYVSTWKNTYVQTAIQSVYENGGVIGGTSAGLAILGEIVFDGQNGSLTSDQAAYNPYHYRVSITDDFLNILPGVFTDSHFNERGRLARLTVMLARRNQDNNEDLLGIGVEYKTAFCVDESMIGTVHGEMVTIIHQSDSSEIQCIANEPPRFTDIVFNQLLDGDQYNLSTREFVGAGSWSEPFDPDIMTQPVFTEMTLNGSEDSIANFGQYVITGLTENENNWWYGDLGIQDGNGLVPHTVIIPKIWNEYDYFPNRIIGGEFGVVGENSGFSAYQDQPFRTIYLDDNCESTISDDGILIVNNLTYVLDVFEATHTGTNNDNMPGIISGRLHFLIEGDTFDLTTHYDFVETDESQIQIPEIIELFQNYPNPFNPMTVISYDLPKSTYVSLIIYDLKGNEIRTLVNENQIQGKRSVIWKGQNNEGKQVPTGVYFYVLNIIDYSLSHKMVYIK
jgi:cyanophycinase